jgi:hypothetical protein
MEGGYCRFYAEWPELCDGGYVTMRDDAFVKGGDFRRGHAAYSREWMDIEKRRGGLQRTHSDPEVQLRSFDEVVQHRAATPDAITFRAAFSLPPENDASHQFYEKCGFSDYQEWH